MGLKEFIDTLGSYLVDWITRKFTGKITFTLNFRDGGIGSVNVNVEHQLKP